MKANEYQAYTSALVKQLEADPRVIGLLALGSMARTAHQPDEWSDHDFYVVTEAGQQEWFRTHSEWAPDADKLVLWFRETEHGVKGIYESGHLIEFAVYDRDELLASKMNAYAVLLDRANLAAEIARIQAAAGGPSETQSDQALFGQFIANVLVGVGRYRRGEQISGRTFVGVWSMYALLRLIGKHFPAAAGVSLDNLDPLRRVEFAYPVIGTEIDRLLGLDVLLMAQGLLDLAEQLFRDRMADYPAGAVAAVRKVISRS